MPALQKMVKYQMAIYFLMFSLLTLNLNVFAQIPRPIIQSGHTSQINFIELSPDGQLYLTIDDIGDVKIWNIESFKVIRHISRFINKSVTIHFSQSKKQLIVSSAIDSSLFIYDYIKDTFLIQSGAITSGSWPGWSPIISSVDMSKSLVILQTEGLGFYPVINFLDAQTLKIKAQFKCFFEIKAWCNDTANHNLYLSSRDSIFVLDYSTNPAISQSVAIPAKEKFISQLHMSCNSQYVSYCADSVIYLYSSTKMILIDSVLAFRSLDAFEIDPENNLVYTFGKAHEYSLEPVTFKVYDIVKHTLREIKLDTIQYFVYKFIKVPRTNYLIAGDILGTVEGINLEIPKILNMTARNNQGLNYLSFDTKQPYLYIFDDEGYQVFDLFKGEYLLINGFTRLVKQIQQRDNEHIIVDNENNVSVLRAIDTSTSYEDKYSLTFKKPNEDIKSIRVGKSGKKLAVNKILDKKNLIEFYDIPTARKGEDILLKNPIYQFWPHFDVAEVQFSSECRYAFIIENPPNSEIYLPSFSPPSLNKLTVIDLLTNKVIQDIQGFFQTVTPFNQNNSFLVAGFTLDSIFSKPGAPMQTWVYFKKPIVYEYQIINGRYKKKKEFIFHEKSISSVKCMTIDKSDSLFALEIFGQDSVYIGDLLTGNLSTLYNNEAAKEVGILFNPSAPMVLTYGGDNIQFWDLNKKKKTVDFYRLPNSKTGARYKTIKTENTTSVFDNNIDKFITVNVEQPSNYLLITDDSYFLSPRFNWEDFDFEINDELLPSYVLSNSLNRPDLVLENLYSKDLFYINQLKIICNLKQNDSAFLHKRNYTPPVLNVQNKRLTTFGTTRDDSVYLKISATSKVYLNYIKVKVNGITLMQTKWLLNNHVLRYEADTLISFYITVGTNKIEVECMDVDGNEIIKKLNVQRVGPPISPKLFLIGLGAGRFLSGMGSISSDQDIRSWINIYKNPPPGTHQITEKIVIDTFINEALQKNKLKEIRNVLLTSGPEDICIIYYSGHGFRDNKKDKLFLAVYDTDLENPYQTGIEYDSIVALMSGIPARNRLILVNACNSGSLYTSQLTTNPLQDFFDNNDYYSETNIIASSGWDEESLSLENGHSFFGETLNTALSFRAEADLDYDKKLSVIELQKYLQEKVFALSNGKQRPKLSAYNTTSNFKIASFD